MTYPSVDSEVRHAQEQLLRALLELHLQRNEEFEIWFWGKAYRIVVNRNIMTVEPVRKT